jgi:hypothetical protein
MSAGAKKRRAHMSYGRAPGVHVQCLGKDRYRTRNAADTAIAKIPGFARAYRCKICGYLHLTSKELRT